MTISRRETIKSNPDFPFIVISAIFPVIPSILSLCLERLTLVA